MTDICDDLRDKVLKAGTTNFITDALVGGQNRSQRMIRQIRPELYDRYLQMVNIEECTPSAQKYLLLNTLI